MINKCVIISYCTTEASSPNVSLVPGDYVQTDCSSHHSDPCGAGPWPCSTETSFLCGHPPGFLSMLGWDHHRWHCCTSHLGFPMAVGIHARVGFVLVCIPEHVWAELFIISSSPWQWWIMMGYVLWISWTWALMGIMFVSPWAFLDWEDLCWSKFCVFHEPEHLLA